MLRFLLFALPIILAVYALVDLVQTDEEDVQGLPKLVWVLLIVLIWVIGPIGWLLAGKRGRRWLPGLPSRGATPQPGYRPTAPDDDPDFLRGLRYNRPPPPAEPDDEDPPAPPTVPGR